MIKTWWKNWGLIDLLALGLGLLLCVAYVVYERAGGFEKPLLDLWPNLATEIVGVWISVRIIDTLIGRREDRRRVRDGVVANLNFMMSICQDLPPQFYDWRLNDLSNELTWFDEKQAAQRKLLKKHFTTAERCDIDAVIQQVRDTHRLSGQAAVARLRVDEVEDIGEAWDRPEEVKQLVKAHHRFINSGGKNQETIGEQIDAVKRGLEDDLYPYEKRKEIEQILDAILTWLDQLGQVRTGTRGVDKSLRELRSLIAVDT